MEIVLANPRGFCAGVDRAIAIVNRALECFNPPIYVRHEVVHNKFVVDDLRQRGAIFVDELDEVPDDNIVIFSAHGVSKAVQLEAERRGLKVFDATCPLVTKVHIEVTKYYLVEDEQDVEALTVRNPEKVAFVTQTTLSIDDTAKVIDALRKKFPHIQGPRKDDICYATQNRQDAVRDLSKQCDVVLVVGSPNSSNSNRLRELAERMGKTAYLVDNADQLEHGWFRQTTKIGVTAGASAPEILIKQVIQRLQDWGAQAPQELSGCEENITFSLPKELRIPVTQA